MFLNCTVGLEVELLSANLLPLWWVTAELWDCWRAHCPLGIWLAWTPASPVCYWEGRKLQFYAGISDLVGQQRWMLLESHGQGGFVHPQMG